MAIPSTKVVPKFKLFYFDGPGRGETVRLLFADSQIPFDDVRFDYQTWLAKYKADMPFSAVPVLEIDGVKYPQSAAIERYLCRTYGYYGDGSPHQQLEIDVIAEAVQDIRQGVYKFYFLPDSPQKTEAKNNFFKVDLPTWLTRLNNILVKNQGGSGFFVGNKMTYADLIWFAVVHNLVPHAPIFDSFPLLKGLHDRIQARPNIAALFAEREATSKDKAAAAAAATPAAATTAATSTATATS